MKSAKQVERNGRTITQITCLDCGRVTEIKGKISSKESRRAIQRDCATCNPPRKKQGGTGWWRQFGLKKNCYVYGPMPHKRTSERWRLQEARERGWLAWYWVDEYTDQRIPGHVSKAA